MGEEEEERKIGGREDGKGMIGNEGMRNIGKGRWKRRGILEEGIEQKMGKEREEENRR